jgi:hypothetical protein
VHATDTTGHTRYMFDTSAVFQLEIKPYVAAAVTGLSSQAVTAALKLPSVMAVKTEAPRTARSSRPALLRPTARSDHRSELLLPQSGCTSDLATNPRRAHMRDKIVSATIASANVKSALHFLATLHVKVRLFKVPLFKVQLHSIATQWPQEQHRCAVPPHLTARHYIATRTSANASRLLPQRRLQSAKCSNAQLLRSKRGARPPRSGLVGRRFGLR